MLAPSVKDAEKPFRKIQLVQEKEEFLSEEQLSKKYHKFAFSFCVLLLLVSWTVDEESKCSFSRPMATLDLSSPCVAHPRTTEAEKKFGPHEVRQMLPKPKFLSLFAYDNQRPLVQD